MDDEELREIQDALVATALQHGLDWVTEEALETFAQTSFDSATERRDALATQVLFTLDALQAAASLIVDLRIELASAQDELTGGRAWLSSAIQDDPEPLLAGPTTLLPTGLRRDLVPIDGAIERLRAEIITETGLAWPPSGSGPTPSPEPSDQDANGPSGGDHVPDETSEFEP
ncbi:MAG: hypothetical protein WKF96_07925 [Solirubrobacteraceae bacterium]